MRAKLRLVAPWRLLVPVVIVFTGFGSLMFLFQAWDDPKVQSIATGALFISAAIVGVHRACVFHPFFRKDYRAWLATTPWTVDEPLPFGPIELDWVDGVIPGALILAYSVVPGHESARIIAIYLFFHCLMLTFSIWGAANHVPAYASLFGLGLMARLWPHAWACAATGVVVYLIVYDGLRISLRDFPWMTPEDSTDARPRECGWPYDRLLKDPEEAARKTRRPPPETGVMAMQLERLVVRGNVGSGLVDYLIWSLLLGWWASCASGILVDGSDYLGFLSLLTVAVSGLSLLVRVAVYTTGYAPPISFWGRIRTGRWIIPGYDVVRIGAVLILVVPLLVLLACLFGGVPWRIGLPSASASALFVALATPPGLRRWRLIGRHRLTQGVTRPASAD